MEDTNLSSGTQATTTIKFESEDLDEASPNPLQLRLLQIHPTAAIPLDFNHHQPSNSISEPTGLKVESDHPFAELMSPLQNSLSPLSASSERISVSLPNAPQGFCELSSNELDYSFGSELNPSTGTISDFNLNSNNCQESLESSRSNRRRRSRPQTLKRRSSSSSSSGSTRPRIKKQITHEELLLQRNQANIRERQRTQSLNQAYTLLRESIPTMPSDKMSKIQTLKLASDYIDFLYTVLSTNEVNPRNEIIDHNNDSRATNRARDTLGMAFNMWRMQDVWQNGNKDFHSPEVN